MFAVPISQHLHRNIHSLYLSPCLLRIYYFNHPQSNADANPPVYQCTHRTSFAIPVKKTTQITKHTMLPSSYRIFRSVRCCKSRQKNIVYIGNYTGDHRHSWAMQPNTRVKGRVRVTVKGEVKGKCKGGKVIRYRVTVKGKV